MVVCPLYQLPPRKNQVYEQAGTRNVCIFSYSHLAVLSRLIETEGHAAVIELLHRVFKTVQAIIPSQDANSYWQAVNRTMLDYGEPVPELWQSEKLATLESIEVSKKIGLDFYASEREAIMRLGHQEALLKLIDMHKIDSRMETIRHVSDNLLMGIT